MLILDQDQQIIFSKTFIEKYLSNGFGAMTKTEMDTLIFHLISDSSDLKDKSNYHISNILKITESRVKALRLNAALKYKQVNHKAVLAKIVTRITEKMDKPDFEEDVVTITIENPVEQRELAHAIKSAGRNIEYGINKELFKISPLGLFELVLLNLENPEQEFTTVIKKHVKDQQKQADLINQTLTFRQRLNLLGNETNDKASLIALLLGISNAL